MRHDAQSVLHAHSLNGVAISAQKGGVLPSLAYHDYEGVALNEGEKARLVADLGDRTFFMLRNHGLLTVGPTIADAFLSMYLFEAACTIQIRAQSGCGPLVPVPDALVATAQQQASTVTKSLGAQWEWPGLLRMLDRRDALFRE